MEVPAVGWRLLVAAGILASVAAVVAIARPAGRWGQIARRRLVMGVPWGTLFGAAGVTAFYLVVQRGLAHPWDPLVIPFRAWGYFYPTGMLTAAFAHDGPNHLVGNLVGTLVFGSIAEYAWSHIPQERGSAAFATLRTNPYARIVAWTVAIGVGCVLSSVFALGPIIGFSGVVFAFVGFALVRYPLATVVGLVASNVVGLVYRALRRPEVARTAGESFSRPWWADVAVQGHALGLFLGVVAAVALLYRRGTRPNPGHVWLAALLVAVDRGLWAVYAIEGSDRFRLFRALGTALVFVLAATVAAGATASGRMLVPSIDLSRREAAVGLLLSVLFALGLVAVPFNLFVVDDPGAGFHGADAVEAGDYTVFYAEGVENQYIPAVRVPGTNTTNGTVEASGVIVVSERRNIWWQVVSKSELASRGGATVRVGGVTWTREVRATRSGWSLAGGGRTYHVRLARGSGSGEVVYRSEAATAEPQIDGRNVTIEPTGDAFAAVVTRENRTLGRSRLPADGNETVVGGLTLRRVGADLYAERGRTRVRVASRST